MPLPGLIIYLCTPRTTWPESSARAGVAPTPGRCITRYTGFRWGSVSPINWLYWLTRCEPQPLQHISASWYRPMHHLGLCALPTLRHLSFLAYTPNWPVALFLLLLHPLGTLYLLTFNCAKTFSLSNATWKPICSNSWPPDSWDLLFHAVAPWTACAKWRQNQFICFQNIMFTSLLADEWTDRHTHWQYYQVCVRLPVWPGSSIKKLGTQRIFYLARIVNGIVYFYSAK